MLGVSKEIGKFGANTLRVQQFIEHKNSTFMTFAKKLFAENKNTRNAF
jgi:hypothetical protein